MKNKAEFLMLAVIFARSTSYIFTKVSLGGMDPFNLLGVRFMLAFVVLVMLFKKKLISVTADELKYGALLGFALYIAMTLELFALKTTDASMVSFIENTAIVYVPVMNAVLCRKLPKINVIVGTLVTLGGVVFMASQGSGFAFTFGETLTFIAAIFYAILIIMTNRVSSKGDPLTFGIIQIGVVGLLGIASSLLVENPHLPTGGMEWISVLALVMVCTVFGFAFQPLAQKYISVERAGQISATNPMSAALLGWVVLGEAMGTVQIIGAALIILGLVVSETRKKEKLLVKSA